MRKLALIILAVGIITPAYAAAGTVLSSHSYAWSNNVGYINFANVTVTDSALGGSAWSANKGFINFSPAQGGVVNDGTGNLSGSAWGEQLGWIDFNNVSIDANGQFSGTATGDLVGTITFDCPNYCDVQTDWRPASTAPSSTGGGGATPAPSEPALASPSEQAKIIDIQKDGVINILDFNALMVNWDSNSIFAFNDLMVYWDTTYQA